MAKMNQPKPCEEMKCGGEKVKKQMKREMDGVLKAIC